MSTRCLFNLSLALLAWPRAAVAQRIEVAAIDTPLVIRGWKGDSRGLLANMLLTARGGSVAQFYFYSSDLVSDSVPGEARYVIARDQVELAEPVAERKLEQDVPKNFRVRVTGFDMPGTYSGRIEIRVAGSTRTEPLVMPLRVAARMRPSLAGVPSDTIRLALVRCRWSCWLASALLPASALQTSIPVQVENASRASVAMRDHAVVVQGEKTRYRPDPAPIKLEPPKGSAFKTGITTMRLTVNRQALPPDRYTGATVLDLDGAEQSKRLLLDISIRAGPMAPIVCLLVGILLGRLVKYMQERGQAQAEALRAVKQLESRIAATHNDDAKVLLPMVDEVRQAVYAEQLTTVPQELDVIGKRLRLLTELRRLEAVLSTAALAAAQPQIASIRTRVAVKDDAKADQELAALVATLTAAPPGGRAAGGRAPDFGAVQRAAAAARAAAAPAPANPRGAQRFARWLKVAAGQSDEFRAELTYWLVRPLLWVLVVVGLTATGLVSLYIENGATFGANPFADYSGLVLWGLGSDVISRGITNLRGG